MSEVKNCALLRARPLATRPDEIMPKGKGKGGRRGGETKAERARQRALARELSAINDSATSTRRASEFVVDVA